MPKANQSGQHKMPGMRHGIEMKRMMTMMMKGMKMMMKME
jgi:hypothetical protein